jgi:hypothetical protein
MLKLAKLCSKLTAVLVLALTATIAAEPPAVAEAPSATSTVSFRNALSKNFELRRVRYWADGVLRYDGIGPFDAPLEPGAHVVSIQAEYRLRDPLLTYVRGYAIRLRSAEHVDSAPGRAFVARAVQTGGVTTPVDRRAQLIWR